MSASNLSEALIGCPQGRWRPGVHRSNSKPSEHAWCCLKPRLSLADVRPILPTGQRAYCVRTSIQVD
eukprot:985213-Alexandrium_andersonii.AAC.1